LNKTVLLGFIRVHASRRIVKICCEIVLAPWSTSFLGLAMSARMTPKRSTPK
jgi:hypothetical protein